MSSEKSSESTQTSQNILNVDGFKKRKFSEQLKLEREIFPNCIQALSTYCNKSRDSNKDTHRKSRRSSLYFTSKENLLLPEKVVESAYKNVEQWLDQQKNFNKLPRKPFLDLNVNVEQHRQSRSNVRHKRSLISDNKENTNNISGEEKKKQRSHFKFINTTTDNQHSYKKNSHRQSRYTKDTLKTSVNKNHNKIEDESGIFVDDTIVIEDSQSTFVDKDREALLAVMRADENYQNSDSKVALDFSDVINYTNDIDKTLCDSNLSKGIIIHQSSLDNVPFLKKSYLYKSCRFCSAIEVDKRKQGEWKDKNILVKIETGNFIATINVIHVENIVNKSSVALQTDISKIYESIVKPHTDDIERAGLNKDFTKPLSRTISVESQDILSDIDNRNHQNKDMVKHVVIYSSESDFEKEDEKNSKGVLVEISKPNRQRTKIVRRPTPASSDSSEKENFDPNKRKRRRTLDKSFKKIKK